MTEKIRVESPNGDVAYIPEKAYMDKLDVVVNGQKIILATTAVLAFLGGAGAVYGVLRTVEATPQVQTLSSDDLNTLQNAVCFNENIFREIMGANTIDLDECIEEWEGWVRDGALEELVGP